MQRQVLNGVDVRGTPSAVDGPLGGEHMVGEYLAWNGPYGEYWAERQRGKARGEGDWRCGGNIASQPDNGTNTHTGSMGRRDGVILAGKWAA